MKVRDLVSNLASLPEDLQELEFYSHNETGWPFPVNPIGVAVFPEHGFLNLEIHPEFEGKFVPFARKRDGENFMKITGKVFRKVQFEIELDKDGKEMGYDEIRPYFDAAMETMRLRSSGEIESYGTKCGFGIAAYIEEADDVNELKADLIQACRAVAPERSEKCNS